MRRNAGVTGVTADVGSKAAFIAAHRVVAGDMDIGSTDEDTRSTGLISLIARFEVQNLNIVGII